MNWLQMSLRLNQKDSSQLPDVTAIFSGCLYGGFPTQCVSMAQVRRESPKLLFVPMQAHSPLYVPSRMFAYIYKYIHYIQMCIYCVFILMGFYNMYPLFKIYFY